MRNVILGDRRADLISSRNCAESVSAEVNVEAVKAYTQLIDHSGRQVMCPAHKDCLAEGRDAHRISGSAIAEIKVEVVAAIEEITGHEVVIATLIVNAVGEVEAMERRLDNALYLGEINAKARSNINAARNVVHGSGIAAGDAEWPYFIVGSQPRASREASRQLCQSCRSGRNIGALENGFG